jgi:hypothetical protein
MSAAHQLPRPRPAEMRLLRPVEINAASEAS